MIGLAAPLVMATEDPTLMGVTEEEAALLFNDGEEVARMDGDLPTVAVVAKDFLVIEDFESPAVAAAAAAIILLSSPVKQSN